MVHEITMQENVVIITPEKMRSWGNKILIAAYILAGIFIYAYLLFFAKTIYNKMQRLERIGLMVMETEKMIHDLHVLDQKIATQLEELDEFYADY